MKVFAFFILLMSVLPLEVKAFVPSEAYTFDFNIKTIRSSRYKESKLLDAVELLREVFASEEFKERILGHRYKRRYRFAYNQGLTNFQIYQKILKGREKLYPYINNAMDVEVGFFTDLKSIVIGYTWPHSKKIWMNTKYFNRYGAEEIAAHLTHEWLHKLGFDHERKRTAVGNIIADIARKLNEDRN